jgi:Ni,Fe-hydrogenase I cytochrome b subunit
MPELKSYTVWDASTRWFHWINAICVIALAVVGFIILNAGDLDISTAGKVTLKTIHVWIGYVFALNLLWRIVWAFMGNRYARWRSVLPGGPGYFHAVRSYVTALIAGHPEQYLGHNPLGRLGVAALLVLIIVQAITGLLLAGTDIFYPPFGQMIAQWVAAPGVDPGSRPAASPTCCSAAARSG